jgi:hypothetical protein
MSFRGALLREPGIHSSDWDGTERLGSMDSGLAGKSPRPGMTKWRLSPHQIHRPPHHHVNPNGGNH